MNYYILVKDVKVEQMNVFSPLCVGINIGGVLGFVDNIHRNLMPLLMPLQEEKNKFYFESTGISLNQLKINEKHIKRKCCNNERDLNVIEKSNLVSNYVFNDIWANASFNLIIKVNFENTLSVEAEEKFLYHFQQEINKLKFCNGNILVINKENIFLYKTEDYKKLLYSIKNSHILLNAKNELKEIKNGLEECLQFQQENKDFIEKSVVLKNKIEKQEFKIEIDDVLLEVAYNYSLKSFFGWLVPALVGYKKLIKTSEIEGYNNSYDRNNEEEFKDKKFFVEGVYGLMKYVNPLIIKNKIHNKEMTLDQILWKNVKEKDCILFKNCSI